MVDKARRGVLVTRPGAEAGALAERLRGMGLTPVVAPLLRIESLPLRGSGACAAVLVTSGNALPSLREMGVRMALPVLAVGDATAERARSAGFTDVSSAGGDAEDLLALVRRRFPADTALLLATGRGQGAVLTAGLRAGGFRVHRRVAYAARPVGRLPDAAIGAIEGGGLRAALFLSAETARVFGRLLPVALRPELAGIEALAIGQPAADALALLPWRRVRVSLGPTLDQVLALL